MYPFLFSYFLPMALTARKKRFVIAMPLGIFAGLLCTWVSSGSVPGIWGSALMWALITDRMLIGLVVGLAGAYLTHPLFGFPLPWYIRGFCLGVFVSLPLATGAMITPTTAWSIFWATLIAGGVYGLIIDFFATKFGGEGKAITE